MQAGETLLEQVNHLPCSPAVCGIPLDWSYTHICDARSHCVRPPSKLTGALSVLDPGTNPRFIADAMLGKLARWLRLLGYDTLYSQEDDILVAQHARSEDRILLTRDRGLAVRRGLNAVLLTSTALDLQLTELNAVIPIPPRAPRCMACNVLLESISLEIARPHIPPFVAETHNEFHRCPQCGGIFWPGTHWDSIRQRLDCVLAQQVPGRENDQG